MKLLLDTHVWLWMGLDPKRLGSKTRRLLEDRANELALSVVSAWEIVLKSRAGRLDLPMEAPEYIRTRLTRSETITLDVRLDHALALDSLQEHHRDPFDRLIVAQALAENYRLVTADPHLTKYPIVTIDARL